MTVKEMQKFLKNKPKNIEIAYNIPGLGDYGNKGVDWVYIKEWNLKFIDPKTEIEIEFE